jgi:hypothetical protein
LGGGGGGAGGAATDAGSDLATGAGGRADDGGSGDAAARDTSAEAGAGDASDASDASDGPTTCTTFYGAGNPVQYAFNGGANIGWYQFVEHDDTNTGLTSSLGASFTERRSCPGALMLAVNFTAYGSPTAHGESGSAEIFYGNPPNGRNWSAYKAVHAWVKVQTADPLGLDGVNFYVRSGNRTKYLSDFGASAMLTDWHELVLDLTNVGTGFPGVISSDIQVMGFEVVLHMTPPAGAPATPSQVILLVDDIWLEALPVPDGGTGDGATDRGAGDGAAGQ